MSVSFWIYSLFHRLSPWVQLRIATDYPHSLSVRTYNRLAFEIMHLLQLLHDETFDPPPTLFPRGQVGRSVYLCSLTKYATLCDADHPTAYTQLGYLPSPNHPTRVIRFYLPFVLPPLSPRGIGPAFSVLWRGHTFFCPSLPLARWLLISISRNLWATGFDEPRSYADCYLDNTTDTIFDI